MRTPPTTGARAAATGQWMAAVLNLLVAHPKQEVTLDVQDGHAQVSIAPYWINGTPITAHALLAHHRIHSGQGIQRIFEGVRGTVCIKIHIEHRNHCLDKLSFRTTY